jgi:hypothetical protein
MATPVTVAGGISAVATGVTSPSASRADAIILPAPLPDFSPLLVKIHGSGQPFSVSCSMVRVRV